MCHDSGAVQLQCCSAAVIPILIAVALDREGNCSTTVSFSTTPPLPQVTTSTYKSCLNILGSYNTYHSVRVGVGTLAA